MHTHKYQDLSKFTLPEGFRGRSAILVQLWWLVQPLLFATSPQFMYGWRRWLLRLFGAKIGVGAIIRPTVRVQFPWKVSIGDYAWVGDHVGLYNLGEIKIGAHAVVSQRSYLCTGSHRPAEIDFPIYALSIDIGAEAWIATDVYIGPGVSVGRGTIVGARSSVFKNLPEGKVCVGSPAKVIRDRPISA